MKFKKKITIVSILITLAFCSGCQRWVDYHHSNFNFDDKNELILIKDGYEIKPGNPYDSVKTDVGYDIILHFIEEE